MAIINFGSINIDHVYQVEHFVQPGETLASTHYQTLLGGKGANQSQKSLQATRLFKLRQAVRTPLYYLVVLTKPLLRKQ
jgi:hypothetical protein